MKVKAALWDIRLDAIFGSLMLSGGKWSHTSGTRIKYRKIGSKGRFDSFVVINGLKGMNPQSYVTTYVKQKNKEREARFAQASRGTKT